MICPPSSVKKCLLHCYWVIILTVSVSQCGKAALWHLTSSFLTKKLFLKQKNQRQAHDHTQTQWGRTSQTSWYSNIYRYIFQCNSVKWRSLHSSDCILLCRDESFKDDRLSFPQWHRVLVHDSGRIMQDHSQWRSFSRLHRPHLNCSCY